MYEAILFDMDGVVVDTYDSVTTFWQSLAKQYGFHLSEAQLARHVYGCTAIHTLSHLFPRLRSDEYHTVIERMYQYEANLHYTAVDGIVAFLCDLKYYSVPTALVTSGSQQKASAVARQLGIESCFDVWVTADDISQGKPAPDCYLQGAQLLGKSPACCIVFEDAVSGVEAAVTAGATCVGVASGKGRSPTMLVQAAPALLQVGARCVVPTFTTLRLEAQYGPSSSSLTLLAGKGHAFPLSLHSCRDIQSAKDMI